MRKVSHVCLLVCLCFNSFESTAAMTGDRAGRRQLGARILREREIGEK